MTPAGMVLLTLFALTAGLCLWLYWRERVRFLKAAQLLKALRDSGVIDVAWNEDGTADVRKGPKA